MSNEEKKVKAEVQKDRKSYEEGKVHLWGPKETTFFSRSRDTIMNVECLICWKFNSVWCRNILLSTRQLSVLLYEGNNKLNLIVTSITESLRNNQANDYLGTKTHLLSP